MNEGIHLDLDTWIVPGQKIEMRSLTNTAHHSTNILFLVSLFLLAFDVGGLGFEFCVFVASWRHALRSEWPLIIIIEGLSLLQSIPPTTANKLKHKRKGGAGLENC